MKKTLTTRRLRLRPLEATDAADFAKLFSADHGAVAMTAKFPNPCGEDEARAWITKRINGDSWGFAILRREDGMFVGSVGLTEYEDRVELGYGIGRAFWGRGYATEAVRAAADYARELGLSSVEACTFTTNPASARVLEKCGFENMGRTTRNYPERGGRRAVVLHVLALAEEQRAAG